jgi:hypothetical protein
MAVRISIPLALFAAFVPMAAVFGRRRLEIGGQAAAKMTYREINGSRGVAHPTLTSPAVIPTRRGFSRAGRRASILRMTRSRAGSGKRPADDKFSHRVDIPVPVGGLGNRLTEMLM